MKNIIQKFKFILIISFLTFSVLKINSQSCVSFSSSIGLNGYVSACLTNPSSGTTYTWNFGGTAVNTGTSWCSSFTFSANGNYSIGVTASGGTPACNSTSMTLITISNVTGCSLVASFWEAAYGLNGVEVFGNQSQGGNSNTNYFWNFGDGTTNNVNSPVHTYSANGVYSISLVASNNASCSSTTSGVYTVSTYCNQNPVSVGLTYTNLTNGSVIFNSPGTGTTNSYYYSWTMLPNQPTLTTFGGNSTMSAQYSNGTYTPNVIAYNGSQAPPCFYTASTVLTVTNAPCSLTAGINNNTMGTGNIASFANNSVGMTNATTYTFYFGDGTFTNTLPAIHTYSSLGAKIYTLSISNSSACTSTYSNIINVNYTCGLNANVNAIYGSNGLVTLIETSTGTFGGGSAQILYGDNTWNNISPGFTVGHTYSANQIYSVTLNRTCTSGSTSCSSSITKTINVNSLCYLNTNFSAIPSGTFGMVNFSNTSIGSNGSTTYTWSFGNSQTSNSFSASTIYIANGTYNVVLTANNNGISGCVSTKTVSLLVSNSTPCALTAGFTYTLGNNGIVSFSNTSQPTTGVTFVWNLGNGLGNNVLNANSFFAQYQFNGTYSVVLTATNSGCNSSTTSSLVVITTTANNACAPNIGFSNNFNANSGTVMFWDNSSNLVSPSYLWKFGDGSTSSSSINPVIHTYSVNGVYNVTLQITNNNSVSCTAFSVTPVTVTNACGGLASAFNYTINGGQVIFNNASINTSSLSTYLLQWDVGNNWMYNMNYTNTPTFSVNFLNGSYNVALTISNLTNSACQSYTTSVITITNSSNCNLTAAFTNTLASNGWVAFSNNSIGTNAFTTYTWNFGDGSGSSLQNPIHTYSSNGTYSVTTWVTDPFYYNFPNYCRDSITSVINVSITPCPTYTANFTQTLTSNGLVNFTDASIGTNSNTIHRWNFGDGWTSALMNPSHTYSNAGTHYVIHSIRNLFCPGDSISYAINITGIPCVANANFNLNPTSTPQNWNAVLVYPYNITSASWSWGDNSTSNTLYTSHQYSAAGAYSICLTVSASCGATAQACNSYSIYRGSEAQNIIYINVVAPEGGVETSIGINGEASIFENKINVFPNPVNNKLMISILDMENSKINISLYDMLGNLVLTESTKNESTNFEKEVRLENLNNGIYFLQIEIGNQSVKRKIIVMKN